ncbi:NlpC/P60 family protein [Halodurantibacterium flavum]|uniref:NlpC/P60 family protein n=1 Tax=Halodurantibacterium flavum TaxID=1382802 RepID=A0ABW4S933_9RHOB
MAHSSLRGKIDAPVYADGIWHRITQPVTDLLARPGGPRDRQALYGERALILDRRDGMAFGQLDRDGYCGWIAETALGADVAATHWVAAPATHAYPGPDIKLIERLPLSFGSRVRVAAEHPTFLETEDGLFIPRRHLREVGEILSDPVAVAEMFLGTPYLWGGNSRSGIDCSGLVQAAHLACGIPCPGDSDLQESALGRKLDLATPPRRGDILFWKGHVALVADEARIIHANGHAMATCHEGLAEALARITAAEGTVLRTIRRLAD